MEPAGSLPVWTCFSGELLRLGRVARANNTNCRGCYVLGKWRGWLRKVTASAGWTQAGTFETDGNIAAAPADFQGHMRAVTIPRAACVTRRIRSLEVSMERNGWGLQQRNTKEIQPPRTKLNCALGCLVASREDEKKEKKGRNFSRPGRATENRRSLGFELLVAVCRPPRGGRPGTRWKEEKVTLPWLARSIAAAVPVIRGHCGASKVPCTVPCGGWCTGHTLLLVEKPVPWWPPSKFHVPFHCSLHHLPVWGG